MKESDYYSSIKEEIERLFKMKGIEPYLEITATSGLSPYLKRALPEETRLLSFPFLKKKPDIVGFVKKDFWNDIIVIEVKEKVSIESIYQTKLYKELLKARYTFLISLAPISVEIEDLCKKNYNILHSPQDSIYSFFVIAEYNIQTKRFENWVEENPFERASDSYWR
jgi:hypothetical protein